MLGQMGANVERFTTRLWVHARRGGQSSLEDSAPPRSGDARRVGL